MRLPEHLSGQRSRSYLPIPVVLGAEGEWEGGAIVRELSTSVGQYLFGTLRDVMLWLVLPPQRRHEAFSLGAIAPRLTELSRSGAPADLSQHLTDLLRVCGGEITMDELAKSCLGVADWARTFGLLHTELAYRQAAALALPRDPALSLTTARLARDLLEHRRAETWFRGTIKLARLQKDWTIYIRAHLGLGTMYGRLGNGPAAKAVTERALRTAERWRLRQLAGEAHHDLFHVWADLGDERRAMEHAWSAHALYGKSQPHHCRLAADFGVYSVKNGAPRRAVPLFQSLLPKMPEVTATAMLLAHLAQAAAQSDQRTLYATVRAQFLRADSAVKDEWRRAECHLHLAYADVAMSEWERARSSAQISASLAAHVGAAEVEMKAEEILSRAASVGTTDSPPPTLLQREETPGLSRLADSLAAALCQAVAG